MLSDRITLTELVENLEDAGQGDELSLGEVLEAIGDRGYAPLFLILGLFAASPLGVVPGLPTVCGLSILLISLQLVYGKPHPWLPSRLRAMSINRERYSQVAERIKPWSRRLDRLVKPRLKTLVGGRATRLIGLLFVVLGLCMPPLELIPFAVTAPGGAIVLISLGLAGHDGLWVLLGLLPAAIGAWLVLSMVV